MLGFGWKTGTQFTCFTSKKVKILTQQRTQCFCPLDTKSGKPNCPFGCTCVESDQVRGRCDLATNLKNLSLEVGIERSTDPTGFTPAAPLAVTSCIEMAGPCAQQVLSLLALLVKSTITDAATHASSHLSPHQL
jgi:hypothetical protein